ncbi:response regulator transcription factor [Carboxylicivirga sp. M1479]|uniref:response regulator transcription factor n=1 Tax=Carboxylicivirga sp. M1479 TaxID=2594476 RepID=UPI001177EBFA|nr:response regulator transcription factor [Carboxylicivirga sp. M1479]TRX70632.1 response regulator transcription factor [Carboxylicivirga sp. M1479]
MIKIAIVEDLPMIQEGLKLLINSVDDFEIIAEYSNGKEFTDDLLNLDVDIVLMDIGMPVMDGIDATKLAVSLRPEMKIIALSVYSDRKYYYSMVTAGAKGFVLKQSTPDELEEAVREVHHDGNFFSPDLLHSIIVNIHGLEEEIVQDKKDLLNLTEHQVNLLELICQGLTNQELAKKMFVTLATIESNKRRLMNKTNTKNNAGLIIWAIKNKVVTI